MRLFISALAVVLLASSTSAQSLNPHDGSNAPPRLVMVQAMWGMNAYPSKEAEWSTEEKLARIKEAGFDAADIGVPRTPEEEQRWLTLASKHALVLGLQTSISKLEDLDTPLAVAKRMKSPYLDVHVGNYYVPEKEATELLSAMAARCGKERIAMMVQTHRGRVTQDLFRTIAYTKAIPGLRFCLDLSHYFVGGDVGGRLSPQADALFDELLKRAPMLDGRVSNGEQVQIDMGAAADNSYTKYFAELWKRAMVHWLKAAKPGDLFIFRVELGPPNYSIRDLNGKEISDRW
ncbi:MAG TPA: sugar phosphate isomerase/epimerase, partial [Blastocatellia bacterium]|nr:sugar phosphate isomerase/epimerase [Blastocatellia bacterium]